MTCTLNTPLRTREAGRGWTVEWRMGAQSTHAPCVYQIFNDLGTDFAGETSRIAREEPT
jgi:hypothetical protein